jgi:translation initiation factor IF-2
MASVKVYELAKELGVDSISLLDKLAKLGIQVKNHMSDLSDADAVTARASLKRTPEVKKPPTRVRKKTPTEGVVAETEEKKTPIIRRKAKSATKQPADTAVLPEAPASKALPESEASEEVAESLTPVADSTQAPHEMALEDAIATALEASLVPVGEGEPLAGAETTPETLNEPTKTIRKKAEIILTPRPVAPRRSILTIVEATAPIVKPVIKPAATGVKGTTTTQDTDGYRIIKMTKENLDEMVQEEAAKRRPSIRDAELSREDVRFADYRKKELVFLPKKKKIPVGKQLKQTQITVAKAQKRIVIMNETIALTDLADQMSTKAVELVRKLFAMGNMSNINSVLDFDTATLLASEYQYEIRNEAFDEQAALGRQSTATTSKATARPPIVTIMGHVDHGKTTLLDTIRKANVVATEAGGITQHIGAYTVIQDQKPITFIDTPGHEAFTEMRSRGAQATDIVILVVSADDGVMPQTREAISHAQAAKVPIIVAVNKIDKPGANPQKVQQSLADLGLVPEEWGGDTMYVPVSALKGTNIDKLLEGILLQAEVLELTANLDQNVQGIVLESRMEKGRGPVVTTLMKQGTLHVGDAVVAGTFYGKVKALLDSHGKMIKEVTPGFAVQILGLNGTALAGELLHGTENEDTAKVVAQNRIEKQRAKVAASNTKITLSELFSKIQSGDLKELNILIKADTVGSVEVVKDSMLKLSNEQVKIKILLAAPGGITESDVLLASASGAIIFGFNVRPETKARQLAEAEHVEIKSYNIIYELLDDVKKSMEGLLDKKKVEKFLGRAEIRQVFVVPKSGAVAGSFVIDGKMIRGSQIRLLRDSKILFEGKMSSLRRFKDDVKEVATGFECGIGIENYNDIKPGDLIEGFAIELIAGQLK